VGELRGALAAAAEKVDELEERERATAAAHKKMVIVCYFLFLFIQCFDVAKMDSEDYFCCQG
jgi:hypothetical protein